MTKSGRVVSRGLICHCFYCMFFNKRKEGTHNLNRVFKKIFIKGGKQSKQASDEIEIIMVHRHSSHDHHRLRVALLGGRPNNNSALKVFFFCATLFGLYEIRISTTTTSNYYSDVSNNDVSSSIMDLPSSTSTETTSSTTNNIMKYYLSSNNEKQEDKDIVLKRFEEANITLNEEQKQSLPTWSSIINQYGSKPNILGLDKCQQYQNQIPMPQRKLAIAGMSSTGTNLIFLTLKNNCLPPPDHQEKLVKKINGKLIYKNIKWQVPWGKHDPLQSQTKENVSLSRNWKIPDDIQNMTDTDSILTLVMVRNPYRWFQSVCSRSYVIDLFPEKDTHSKKMRLQRSLPCPYIIDERTNTSHPIGYNTRGGKLNYSSLAHAWNEWNNEYYFNNLQQQQQQQQQPTTKNGGGVNLKTRLMVRMEDLIFFTKEIITDICTCMGLIVRNDRPFQYEEETVKSKHNGTSHIGLIGAWNKFGNPPPIYGGLTLRQYNAAKQYLDSNLMNIFNYHHPPSSIPSS